MNFDEKESCTRTSGSRYTAHVSCRATQNSEAGFGRALKTFALDALHSCSRSKLAKSCKCAIVHNSAHLGNGDHGSLCHDILEMPSKRFVDLAGTRTWKLPSDENIFAHVLHLHRVQVLSNTIDTALQRFVGSLLDGLKLIRIPRTKPHLAAKSVHCSVV